MRKERSRRSKRGRFARLGVGVVLGLLCVLAARPATAQTRVTASVSENTVGMEDGVVYSLMIQGEQLGRIETPEPPTTEGLVLASRFPSTSRNISIVNGSMQQSLSFQWTYRPIREGTARFAAATVRVGAETYTTDPIAVTVVGQSQRPPSRQGRGTPAPGATDPFTPGTPAPEPRPAAEDLFIRVVPSKRSAFQNEQVAVEYRLYFREGIQLRESRLTNSWDAEGFWREELDVETRPIPRAVVENGLRYYSIVLKRAAVFPTRSGELRIDPLKIETEAMVPTRSSDPFSRFFSMRSRYRPVEVASPPLTISAQPLPGNAPDGFSGAVGQFQMRTDVAQTEVEVGRSVELTVTISGTGNLATLEMPSLELPSVFEQYDPQVDLAIDRAGNRIRGAKTFSYVLVPRSNGTFEIPPIVFSYFDPAQRQYRTHRSAARTIRVTGEAMPLPAAGATADGLPVDDIAGPLTGEAAWYRTDATPLHRHPMAYFLLVLPLLALGGLFVYQRKAHRLATDVSFARNRRAHPLAQKHLRQAAALRAAGDARAFYEEVERAVLGFIGNRLNVAEQGLTRERLDALLAAAGAADTDRADLRALLDACDRVRFAPVLPDEAAMESDHERAGRLIVSLNEAFRQTAAV